MKNDAWLPYLSKQKQSKQQIYVETQFFCQNFHQRLCMPYNPTIGQRFHALILVQFDLPLHRNSNENGLVSHNLMHPCHIFVNITLCCNMGLKSNLSFCTLTCILLNLSFSAFDDKFKDPQFQSSDHMPHSTNTQNFGFMISLK